MSNLGDSEDRSVKRKEKESPARKAPAKKEQREKHKERQKALQKAVRVHRPENILQRARAFSAAQRTAREESEAAKARQQERRAVAEPTGTDQAAAGRGERGRSAGDSARRRTE